MKNNLHRIIKHPLFWAFITMLLLIFGSRQLFVGKDNVPILAAVVTGSVVMFGYFATHYLTMVRELKEKKFNQCLELIKKIRFFVLEEHIKGKESQCKLRDELQDAYFAFAFLTSEKSYKALSEMMNAFKLLLADPNQLCEFKKAQSKFLNSLRKEFFIDKEIEFETYDFRLSQDEIQNEQK